MRARKFPVNIMGRPSRSAATVPQMFTYESLDQSGRGLCLGETVILPEDIDHPLTFAHKVRDALTVLRA